jgi:hypothetical protein
VVSVRAALSELACVRACVSECVSARARVRRALTGCALWSSDEPVDGELPAGEVSRTLERLFAIPTQAYTNAFGAGADMRPAMPTFTFGPEDGGIMKLGLPSFALSETASASSASSRARAAPTTSLAQQDPDGEDSVMSDLLGREDASARPSAAASMSGFGSGLQQEVDESHKWGMGSQWLSLAQKSATNSPQSSTSTFHTYSPQSSK